MIREPWATIGAESGRKLDPKLCAELCRAGVTDLEPHRRDAMRRRFHLMLVIALTAACVWLLVSSMRETLAIAVGCAGFVTMVVFIVTDSRAQGQYSAAFNEWRARALRAIHPDAHLEPDGYLPPETFDSAGINQDYYNRYSGDTLLRVGTASACNLRVTHVYTESGTGKDDSDRTREDDVFTGVLLQGRVRMPHPGWVVLLPRPLCIPRQLTSTPMISPELTKSYSIGANDPFIAHRILDPSKQSSVWEFSSNFRPLPRIAYRDDVLFVGLDGVRLDTGRRPSLLHPVRTRDLEAVIVRCEEGIELITQTLDRLAPETTDDESEGRT